MKKPWRPLDVEKVDDYCAVLKGVADQYAKDSPEHAALFAAAHALLYVRDIDTKAKFQEWVDRWKKPPTALQVLHARLAGINDLPHELMDETLCEIDDLMTRLRERRE